MAQYKYILRTPLDDVFELQDGQKETRRELEELKDSVQGKYLGRNSYFHKFGDLVTKIHPV